jgi:excisionase family DNA binding protein
MSVIERSTYTVPEAAQLLGLSRNRTYEAIAAGEVPALRIGRRVLVPRAALERMLSEAGSGNAA